MTVYDVVHGESPLVVSVPHAGTLLPDTLGASLQDTAQPLPDTDWFVDQLYGFAKALGASLLVARYSRYAIDLNRPEDDAALYPGRAGSGLVPEADFAGRPLWTTALAPEDRTHRIEAFWRPYHAALDALLEKKRLQHGHAVLWDAHSIRARVPRLFEGRLPDLNLGTNGGRSCAPSLQAAVEARLAAHPWTWVSNGRFRGGHITRSRGRPETGVHALQMEIAQEAYMVEDPPTWDPDRAAPMQTTLRDLLVCVRDWRPHA